MAELSRTFRSQSGLAQCPQRQLPRCGYGRNNRRILSRQVWTKVHLHLQYARLHARSDYHHARMQLPDAFSRIPYNGYFGRCRSTGIVDLHLGKLRNGQPWTQYRHFTDGLGHWSDHHSDTRNTACSTYNDCRFSRSFVPNRTLNSTDIGWK